MNTFFHIDQALQLNLEEENKMRKIKTKKK